MAGMLLGTPAQAEPVSSATSKSRTGFRRLSEHEGSVFFSGSYVDEAVGVQSKKFDGFYMAAFVVECPYPVGSKAWIAIADRDEAGRVVLGVELDSSQPTRRMMFPRISSKEEGAIKDEKDLYHRACMVYAAVCEHGFDTARGPDHEWQVVHVEYRCPDGEEHILVGLPASWDPRLCLGISVRDQIL